MMQIKKFVFLSRGLRKFFLMYNKEIGKCLHLVNKIFFFIFIYNTVINQEFYLEILYHLCFLNKEDINVNKKKE